MSSNIGIYKITNLLNNKIYIGSTSKSFNIRWGNHKSKLKDNKHYNKHLQYAYNKYGSDNFKYEILEVCLKEDLIKREQYYIDTLKPQYNINPEANRPINYKNPKSQKHIENLKKAALLRKYYPARTPEWKEKIGQANKFRVLPNSKLKIPGLSIVKGYFTVAIQQKYSGRFKTLSEAFKLWLNIMKNDHPNEKIIVENAIIRYNNILNNSKLLEELINEILPEKV